MNNRIVKHLNNFYRLFHGAYKMCFIFTQICTYQMDPNQFNWQAYFHYMQNYQHPPKNENSQNPPFFPMYPPLPNNPNMFSRTPMSPNFVESSTEIPQYSTQVSLEDITLDEGRQKLGKKKLVRVSFSKKEDALLVQTWLNVSKDAIVGVDKKASSF